MAGDRRRLAVAVLAAAAVGLACVVNVEAQTPANTAARKAKAKAADAEQAEGETKQAPAKKKKQDPAEAQRAIDAAVKLLEAGKAEPAAQALSVVVGGGNLPPAIMARALYYRGIAYRQQKKPAQAIADLTSALWLKGGLGGNDRTDALKQRASAYQEAGLTDGGETIAAAAPNTAPSASAAAPRTAARTASAAPSSSTGTTTSEAPATSLGPQEAPAAPKAAGSGWSNPFAGWFGGSTSASSSPSPPASTPQTTGSIATPPTAPAAPPGKSASAWTSEASARDSAAPTRTAAAKPEGRFRIQVGMVRTQDEAKALADKVKREHAAALAAREPEIDQAVVGNMGSFYRVRVGPFATQADSQAACAKLKGAGLDCLVVAQ